jgi:translation elongation factor P/translation initiation factor 5A
MLAAVLVVGLTGCGDGKAGLLGAWAVYRNDSGLIPEETLELFKDGNGMVDDETITWSAENKRLMLKKGGDGFTCGYKISGYELTLIYKDGDSAVLVKKEKMENYVKKHGLGEKMAGDCMAEAHNVLVSFESACLAAVAEKGNNASIAKSDLIFQTPTNSRWFTYELSADVKTCTAKAKIDIADFKKGDYIATAYNSVSQEFVHSGNNDAAVRKMIPNFAKGNFIGRAAAANAQTSAPSNQQVTERDRRLVNAKGKGWLLDDSEGSGDIVSLLIFRNDGSCTWRYASVEPDEKWASDCTWSTDGAMLIIRSNEDGRIRTGRYSLNANGSILQFDDSVFNLVDDWGK